MADSKYGRLFTEADVKLMLERLGVEDPFGDAVVATADELAGRLTFPADEPLFLMRAKDEAALAGLYGYQEGAIESDASKDHLLGVKASIDAFAQYLRTHVTKVGD